MREKLNDNPKVQMALIALLLVVAAVFFLGIGGGGESEEGGETGESVVETVAPTAATATETGGATPVALPAPGSGPGALPPPPKKVVSAFRAGDTVALLFVHDVGIDQRLAERSVSRLKDFRDVATFVVPSHKIAPYVSITQGVDLNRLPALVVIRPKRLDKGFATASVHYGFQKPQNIVQAIVDAGYHGGTHAYHP